MITDVRIYVIVGAFMITCIALMVFNFVIIRRSQGRNEPSSRRVKKWRTLLHKHIVLNAGKESDSISHEKYLLRKLPNTENFVVYYLVLQEIQNEYPEEYKAYTEDKYVTFQKLSLKYAQKTGIARAFFADFICNFPRIAGDTPEQLVNILITYIDDSSIHCRTNVLRALCSIGHVQGVINTIQVINEKSLFMHNKLLTNELLNFRGNRDELAEHLWRECYQWNVDTNVSVVQYITAFSNAYVKSFMPTLQDSSVNPEIRIAIIRYYARYRFDPARTVLIKFIDNPTDINLSIVSASALALYPSQDTFATLRRSLSSANWHVRFNSASTLARLGGKVYLADILSTETDRYAKDIVTYTLKQLEEQEQKQENN